MCKALLWKCDSWLWLNMPFAKSMNEWRVWLLITYCSLFVTSLHCFDFIVSMSLLHLFVCEHGWVNTATSLFPATNPLIGGQLYCTQSFEDRFSCMNMYSIIYTCCKIPSTNALHSPTPLSLNSVLPFTIHNWQSHCSLFPSQPFYVETS